jgi:hypothetical protein
MMTPEEKELVQGLYNMAVGFTQAQYGHTNEWGKWESVFHCTRDFLELDPAPTEEAAT